jgi:hypothetical protein
MAPITGIGIGATNTERRRNRILTGIRRVQANNDHRKTADDFNYLPFNTNGVNTSRFEVGGKRSNNTGLDALYIPKEISTVRRKAQFFCCGADKQWKSLGDIPITKIPHAQWKRIEGISQKPE